ncbi:MAG: hypothetical protein M3Y26_06765 [Actinomycetota bacterium]|nr:hypothetical protein [Actinomycetota bacterium]
MSTTTHTIVDHGAYAEWVSEHRPSRAWLTILVPIARVASDDFQRILERLRLVALRFDTEVDPELLGELVDQGITVPGVGVTA